MEFTQCKKEKVFLRGRGGSDAEHLADAALFHELLKRHEELERITTKTKNGIEAITRVTSNDTKLVKILQDHALGMKKRFDSGRAVRSWDMLFVELFDHKEKMEMHWEMLENGIKITLTAKEPGVLELIHLHDETLHAFVDHGFKAAREESPYRQE